MDFLVDPVFLPFVLGILFVWLVFRRHWHGVAIALLLLLGGLYFLSTAPGANLLLRPLEDRYPALLSPPEVMIIVVLSGGENFHENRPIPSTLPSSTLARMVEGVRLFWALEGRPTLWFVGGQGFTGKGVPLMAQAAWELGVPREKVRWLTASKNTWEDAALVAENLGEVNFILVTSAFHMPRALRCFWAHGLAPIPAPCDQRAVAVRSLQAYLPSSQHLFLSALALREYAAFLWYRLRYFRG